MLRGWGLYSTTRILSFTHHRIRVANFESTLHRFDMTIYPHGSQVAAETHAIFGAWE